MYYTKAHTLTATIISFFVGIAIGFILIKCNLAINSNTNIKNEAKKIDNNITIEYEYILKSYDDKLAVFVKDYKNPEIIFDVYLHQLPDLDAEKIKNGMPIKDYKTLISILEDYTS